MPGGIAIIGMSGRFPGAGNIDEYWRNLRDGVESLRPFTSEELDEAGVPPERRRSPNWVNVGGPVDGIEFFDADFFGYSPREAQGIDPQQRVFLECAWHAMEDAGYDPRDCPATGIWAGTANSTYIHHIYSNPEFVSELGGYQVALGNDRDHLCTRVAYKLDLRGPAVTVQTACSTSLVAVCVACQALLNQQCDMALAGGVSIRIPQATGYTWEPGGIFSPDGHCRAFDADARGMLTGNGAGVVVLKRLAQALADGDHIYAVIRGSAINNDGGAKTAYTAPSIAGQAEVIALAQALSDVDPATISFVEAHGTGTALGDPIEIAALTQVFRARTDGVGFCAVGSVKSNIGHLDPAAGVASLIKTALALQHCELPPSLHFRRPNPHIAFAESPFYVNAALQPWPRNGTPRRAGVSSFGIGGTNAHLVLEEAPEQQRDQIASREEIVPISARSAAALERARQNLVRWVADPSDATLHEVAFTLQHGRRAFAYRRAIVCSSREELRARLRVPFEPAPALDAAEVAFLFPGQGSQYGGMAAGLYRDDQDFTAALDECLAHMEPALSSELVRCLRLPRGAKSPRLDQTSLAQPALFAVEYALARMWMAWGVRPAALLGHSVGEYVAACLSGVFSVPHAVALVSERGRLMQSQPPGSMIAAAADEEALREVLGEEAAFSELAIGAVNGPAQCVASGPRPGIEKLHARLTERGIPVAELHTSHAFHSTMMDPVLAPFRECVARVRRGEPEIPFLSNVTGEWITCSEAQDPSYWATQLRSTVRFRDGVRILAERPNIVFLECGAGRTLARLVRAQLPGDARPVAVSSLPHRNESITDRAATLEATAACWTAGVAFDWDRVNHGRRARRISLPGYPFERRRHWVDGARAFTPRAAAKDPVRYLVPAWTAKPSVHDAPAGGDRWLIVGGGEAAAPLASALCAARYDESDLERAIAACTGSEDVLRVVHCGNLSPTPSEDAAYFSLLSLAKALAAAHRRAHIDVVSTGMRFSPEKSLAIGPCRVIPQEYPTISCRLIDVDELAVETIVQELRQPLGDFCVAVREQARYVLQYVPAPIEAGSALPWRSGGVYLITGGFSGIGLAVAEHIGRDFGARVVLVARSGPSPEALAAMGAIEDAGGGALALVADISCEQRMREVVELTVERYGAIHGVIHSAGVAGAELVETTTRDGSAAVFAPKVEGVRVLRRVLESQPLDFVVLFSSLAVVAGGIGNAAYAAANAYLDAVANSAGGSPPKVVSINWPTWRETGMAVAATRRTGPGSLPPEILEHGISTRDGIAALERILLSNYRQVVVMPAAVEPSYREAEAAVIETREAGTPLLAGTWRHLLGVENVRPEDNLFDLGGHSLLALQLISRVRDQFGVDISLHDVFNSPTLASLSALVESAIDDRSMEAQAVTSGAGL